MLEDKKRKPEQAVAVPHQAGHSSYQLPQQLDEPSLFLLHSVAHKEGSFTNRT